MDKSYS